MYSITKSFKFEASHRLFDMPSNHQCRNIHGHSYVVNVTISVDTLKDNMVIDFGKLKQFQTHLDKHYDHSIILNPFDKVLISFVKENKLKHKIMFDEPTAENMCRDLWIIIRDLIEELEFTNKGIIKVEVYETVNCSASFEQKFEI